MICFDESDKLIFFELEFHNWLLLIAQVMHNQILASVVFLNVYHDWEVDPKSQLVYYFPLVFEVILALR